MEHDTGAWLEGLGLGEYAEAFAKNGVDLRALPHLSEDDLKELGVLLGHRRILLAAIQSLQDRERTRQGEAPASESQSQGEVERRQLTVMFCDLVDPPPSQFGPDQMHYLDLHLNIRIMEKFFGGRIYS